MASVSAVFALDTSEVTGVSIGIVAVLVVALLMLMVIITKWIGRLVVVVVVAGLILLVWQQRTRIQDSFKSDTCDLDVTFLGMHVDVPQSVRDACKGK